MVYYDYTNKVVDQMSFKLNSNQQLTLSDSFNALTSREQKALEKSWAKVFAEELFPSIDEEHFSVLYSSNASRPNTPVNVIVGAMIIKEMFDLSDDEVVENLMLDPRYQYALHTTSYEEQPLSDKSLSRFRKRLYDYETLHEVDLFHDCVTDLGEKIAKMMELNGRIRRMDSMMIEASIRRLSRMELLYTCNARLVIYLHKNGFDHLLSGLEHYYDPDDYNKVIYHNRSEESSEKILKLLNDADKLLDLCKTDFDDVTEYQLLVRCISEQTVVDNSKRRLKTKKDGTMGSDILQNPSDPEATFRTKAGKEHRGYAANLEETVGNSGTVITGYAYDQNTMSDSQFLKDHLEQMKRQDETITMITDGAYSGEANTQLAAAKNVELVTTDLTGREANDIYADFEFSPDGKKLLHCAGGHEPKSCSYMKSSGQCRVSFARECCVNCPHKDQCKPKIHKRVSVVVLSSKSVTRAKHQRAMQTEKFKNCARIRNGVETVPSILRRKYHVDVMPVRGLLPGKLYFGCKIAALNFKKLFNYRKGLGHYAQNPVLA